MNREVVQNARDLAEKTTGINSDNILICATHTHTGPVMRDSAVGKRDRVWEEELARKIAGTIGKAQRNATKAWMKIGVGKENRCVFNRRYRMKDGTVATIPWRDDNRDVLEPRGPIDPEVGVIALEDLEGGLLSVLVNYANHCDTVEGNMLSADYPGWLGEVIRRAKGGSVVTIFTAGAQGDIMHVDATAKGGPVGYEAAKYVGNVLSEVVLETLEASKRVPCRLRTARRTISLPIRQFSEQEVEEARRTAKRWFADRFDRIYAKRILSMAVMKEKTIETEIQAVALNNTVLVGVPGEMFVELGLAIKTRSPFRHTFIVGLANDQVPGYIVTSQAYEDSPSRRGIHNYEAQTTALAKGSGERVMEEVLRLLTSLA
jgi:hypothetical protein